MMGQIGVSGYRILGGSAGGISVGSLVGRCGVDCVLISHVIYVPCFKIAHCTVLALMVVNMYQGQWRRRWQHLWWQW